MTVGNPVPKWIEDHLSENEIEKLEKLVADIETRTEGEIVPVLVRQSLLGQLPFLAQFSWFQSLYFSKHYLQVHADLRAELEFYRSRVYNTKKKTGILLFMSFYERRAVVLADKGIADLLPATVWDQVVSQMTGAMKTGKLCDGLSSAITQCGEILIQHFPQKDPDENQLGNRIQFRD